MVGLTLFFFKNGHYYVSFHQIVLAGYVLCNSSAELHFGEADLSTGRFRYLDIRVLYFLKFFFELVEFCNKLDPVMQRNYLVPIFRGSRMVCEGRGLC